MALTVGQLLGGAGTIARRQRETEEAERVARENQLKIEQQNRMDRLRRVQDERAAATTFPEVPSQYVDFEQIGDAPSGPIPVVAPPAAPRERLGTEATTSQVLFPGESMQTAPMTGPAAASPFEGIYNRLKGNQANIQAAGRGMSAQELLSVYALSLRKGDVDTASRIEPFLLVTHKVPQQELASIKRQLAGIRREDQDVSPLLQALGFGRKAAAERQAKELARLQEIRTGEKPIPTAVPAAVPAAAPTTGATKAAQDYDKKVTPYDALIQQSAAQYGLNPVIFRRLLGTESSFDPNKVSPRGESFGLGIAQIADVHGLTREQKLDPNVAIPFAAQLFADYLAGNDGDYVKALEQYKGASTEAGRTAMAKPIRDILSGVMETVVPAAEAATTANTAAERLSTPPGVRTTAEPRPESIRAYYAANPQNIGPERQNLDAVYQQQRSYIQNLYNDYVRAGMGQQALQLLPQVTELDQKYRAERLMMDGMEALAQLEYGNDPRAISQVLSYYRGQPVNFELVEDGTYRMTMQDQRGQMQERGVYTKDRVKEMAQEYFDPTYVQRKQAVMSEAAMLRFKSQLKREEGISDQQAQTIREVTQEIAKANLGERANVGEFVVTNTGEGTAILTNKAGTKAYVINIATGQMIRMDGVPVPVAPTAVPVTGMGGR